MIVDISKWQGDINWEQVTPQLDFVIIKCTGDAITDDGIDPYFETNTEQCKKYSIPMHLYHYLMAYTVEDAIKEADKFYKTASPYDPQSYVLDIEGDALTTGYPVDMARAFIGELRRLGAKKVGLYTGHHAFKSYGFTRDMADWQWLARYGKNTGDIPEEDYYPYECDLWQYTSNGHADGVSSRIDVSVLWGKKPMSYFTTHGGETMEKIFTAKKYVDWLNKQVELKRPYWYGTCFQLCTNDQLERKTKQYPDHYTSNRTARYKEDIANGQYCGDCVGGAIKGAAWTDLGTHKMAYQSNGVPDKSADGMFDYCKSLGAAYGKIETIPEQPGIAVRMAGHVGIYVGNGKVDEWRGFKYGDVQTNQKDRPWTDWYELPWVNYENEGGFIPAKRTLKYGCVGSDVKALQNELITRGYKLGTWGADGEFGKATEDAVKEFQKDNGLTADGIVGEKTYAVLEEPPKTYTAILRGLNYKNMEDVRKEWPDVEVIVE